MKTTKKYSAILAISACTLLTTSCEKFIEYEGDYAPPRLVLNGVAQADSAFHVQLSQSRSFLESGPLLKLGNGVVRIFDGQGTQIETLTHTGDGVYRGTQSPQPGATYTVRASAGNFQEIWATQQVPVLVPITQLDTVSIEINEFGFASTQYELDVRFADPVESGNFYMLDVYIGQKYSLEYIWNPNTNELEIDTIFFENPFWSSLPLSTADQVLIAESDLGPGETRYYAQRFLFTDALFNGASRTFSLRCEYIFPGSTLRVRLGHISEDLYLYLRSLDRYDYTDGDPFAEPVLVRNNIQGDGLGIWGGASTAVRDVDIPF